MKIGATELIVIFIVALLVIPLRDAIEPFEDIGKSIKKDLDDVNKDIKNIGKPEKKSASRKAEAKAESKAEEEPAAAEETSATDESSVTEVAEEKPETTEDNSKGNAEE